MLENREYWRQGGESPWETVTVRLLLANVAVFVVQSLLEFYARSAYRSAFGVLALNPTSLFHGCVWQLFTFQFLHANFWHLAGNSIMIFFLGRELENFVGKSRFLGLYLMSGVVGGLLQAVLGLLIPAYFGGPVVGASAGAFGLLAAFALLFPEHIISLFLFYVFPVNIRAKYLLVGGLAVSILGVLIPNSQVAHAAHLGGMLTGIAFIRYRFQEMSFNWPTFRRGAARPQLVATSAGRPKSSWQVGKAPVEEEDLPPAEFISKEVDPILDKISAQGIHSLTKRERAILESARRKIDRH